MTNSAPSRGGYMSSVPHSSGLAAASARCASDPGPTSLSDYGTALARRWWLVLLGMLIGGAAAAGYLNVVHKSYTSTSAVQVTDTGVSDSAIPGSRNTTANVDMDTEAADRHLQHRGEPRGQGPEHQPHAEPARRQGQGHGAAELRGAVDLLPRRATRSTPAPARRSSPTATWPTGRRSPRGSSRRS